MRRIATVAVAAAALGLGACGGSGSTVEADAARTALIDHLRARASAAATVSLARSFEERLPNVQFQTPTGRILHPIRQAVLGDVVGVEPGEAFWNVGPGSTHAPDEKPDSFDDPSADWRTIHLVVEVAEAFGDPIDEGRVRVGMPISGSEDPRVLMEGAAALGRVFLLLQDTDMYAYAPGIVGMPLGGEYLMTVNDDGTIHLPVADADGSIGLLGQLRSFDDLRRAMAGPTRLIPVEEPSPGYYVRSETATVTVDGGTPG